ncbi:Paramyosin, short form [Armadillidium nasatum]|uniref:Paramyosin n=1 Tax=Armadillidium nasatum TaxID=96803 RepID=A0A5N5TIP7_9CRUS|nr:Paramyosin, short form [Armadillidium nasatum]
MKGFIDQYSLHHVNFTFKKQMAIEIDQLNARVVEAETRLKTEELQNAYDEIQRQLQQTLDLYGVAQRKLQSLTAEYEEARANLESVSYALTNKLSVASDLLSFNSKKHLHVSKDLSTININLSNAKSKLEQEISIIAGDYDEVSKELRLTDERLQKTSVELKRTTEILHEEQERYIKVESIKKSLEVEVKNLTIRIENVEANALANTKRMVSKLEARVHDLELELDEERRRHNETAKILKKKERNVKELVLQCEEDHKNIMILQDTLDKTYEKVNIYKRQLNEHESVTQNNITRVRRFQRELEAAEERAENAESNLTMIRAKHRTFVTSQTTSLPGGEQVIIRETVTTE